MTDTADALKRTSIPDPTRLLESHATMVEAAVLGNLTAALAERDATIAALVDALEYLVTWLDTDDPALMEVMRRVALTALSKAKGET